MDVVLSNLTPADVANLTYLQERLGSGQDTIVRQSLAFYASTLRYQTEVKEESGDAPSFLQRNEPEPIVTNYPLPAKRRLGRDKGLLMVAKDFNDPLPDDIIATFEQPLP